MNSSAQSAEKSQAELIFELQQRQRTRFNLGVNISWVVLLSLLFFAFSGIRFEVFGVGIKTIRLDWAFIREYGGFISGGVGLTILLSVLSISLASVLAFLGALGRLSKFPPAYALASFYISLIRGTPLLLQIFFFFLALPQMGIRLTGMTRSEELRTTAGNRMGRLRRRTHRDTQAAGRRTLARWRGFRL